MGKGIKKNWLELPIENILAPNDKGVILGQGWSPQCEKQPSQSEDDWGVLKTTAIQAGYFLEEENKLLPAYLEPRIQHEVKSGDLLITCAGPRNRCGVACLVRKTRKRLLISGKMYRFRINEKIALPEFVEFFLLSQAAWKEIDKMKTGGSDSGLNLTHTRFKKLIVPIPPLSVQQAIVSKIEELLSDLDNGKQQLQLAQQQLKVYRQSLLKWAFEGKFTNKNVKEGELPKGWKLVRFGELFSNTPQNGLYKPSTQYGSGTPIVRIDGFYDGVILSDYEYKRVRLTEEEIKKYLLSIDDILVNRVNSMSHLGKCGLVRSLNEKTVFESNVMKIQVKKELAFPKYITSYLASSNGIKELTKNAKHAVNQASINQTDVSNAVIPLPPAKEQQQIMDELESKLTVCDKIEETISQSLQQAETLRQSILKKAFEGKLISLNYDSDDNLDKHEMGMAAEPLLKYKKI